VQYTYCSAAAAAVLPYVADFTYNENKTGNLAFPGATHQGFTAIANTLWNNGLRAALYSNVVQGTVTSVSVAGHSLGAGVAQLVAYATQVSSAPCQPSCWIAYTN
jgi:hypothetical protein